MDRILIGEFSKEREEPLKLFDSYASSREASKSDCNVHCVPKKTPFRLKRNNNGNLLSVHHTVREGNQIVRIRLGACCFSDRGKFVAIDKRGNIFIFDLNEKYFWKLSFAVLKSSIIVPNKGHESEFLIGTKTGQLFLIDIERSVVIRACQVSMQTVHEISLPEYSHSKKPLLVHAGSEAIMVDMNSFTPTHRLDFDQARMALKFACYIPHTEQIFTCFTNDSIHIWSSSLLKTVNKTYPIKTRNRKLRLAGTDNLPSFKLVDKDCDGDDTMFGDFEVHNFSDGLINAYCFTSQSGGILCLATVDKYLLMFNYRTFDLQHIIRLHDFIIDKCAFLHQPNQMVIIALTSKGKALILDCQNNAFKVIGEECIGNIEVSNDGKLLSVIDKAGEADIWKTDCVYNTMMSQQHCLDMIKEAFKQTKPVTHITNEGFSEDIKKLLHRDRLLAILKEYGFFPDKYRNLIWCSLLQLPCNRANFQDLLRLNILPAVRQRVEKLQLKDETSKRALIKIWSCICHWCKVFAYSDFFPNLILPFVKMFPKNGIVAFEVIVTLLMNHFQLWFEFHPMPPTDYLGMCENLLQYFDNELWTCYSKFDIKAKEFAWPILSSSFSEVLDREQWLILWDHIVSCPAEFIIFCVVAYNILLREVIMLLPDKAAIESFFHERNPISVHKLVKKSLLLMKKCSTQRNPARYFEYFTPIPRNVYPKFLRYPQEWVAKQENELLLLQREQEAIEERIRKLEVKENKIITDLEECLKREEHAKRLKEMESLYYDAIKREEERVACQRKLLCLYQKEIRTVAGRALVTLNECEYRKRAIEMETQLERLMHNIESERRRINSSIILVEDELKNQNFDMLKQRTCLNRQSAVTNLGYKFKKDISQLQEQRNFLYKQMDQLQNPRKTAHIGKRKGCWTMDFHLTDIEQKLEDIQSEFMGITSNT